MAEALNKEFNEMSLRQLECPICFEYCVPPIVQCVNGHNVCAECRPRIRICAICKGQMTDIRNRLAEEISQQMTVQCKYKEAGCSNKFVLQDIEAHEKVCTFGATCMCKVPSQQNSRFYVPCEWRGSRLALIAHVASIHQDSSFVSPYATNADFNSTHRLMKSHRTLVSFGEELFWVLKSYDFRTASLRGLVCIVGSEAQADKYEYHIALTLKDEVALIKRGSVVSFDDFFCTDEGNNALGFIVEGKKMLDLFNKNGFIRFRVRISLKANPIAEFNWQRFNQAAM